MTPDWLPPKISLSGSSLESDYKFLYEIFKRDFIDTAPAIIDDCEVVFNNVPDKSFQGKYPYGFTHLVTKGKDDRFIDYERANKLPWVRAVLDNHTKPEVAAFYVNKMPGVTLYLWVVDCDFVVILRSLKSKKERNTNTKIIITAYDVDQYGRKALQKLYGRSSKQLQ